MNGKREKLTDMYEQNEKLIYMLVRKAQEDWRARHLCLPSLVVALAFHDMGGNKILFPLRKDGCTESGFSVEEAVRSHNTYLARWKAEGQARPNWEGLAEQTHYILAVQYLQDAQYPYYPEETAEAELVGFIEQNGLARFDGIFRK